MNYTASNSNDSDGAGGGQSSQKTAEVVLPGDDFVLDHWTVTSGSVVRAGDIVAYARRRGDDAGGSGGDGSSSETTAQMVPKKTVHKRPTRRKRPQTQPQSQPAAQNNLTVTPATTTAAASVADTNKKITDRITAKFTSKEPPVPLSIHLSSDPEAATETDAEASSTIPNNGKTVAIRATAGGIIRPSTNHNAVVETPPMVIGCVEECLHPTFVFGLCAVCGMSETDARKDSGGSNNHGNSNVYTSNRLSNTNTSGGRLVTVSGGATLVVSEQESLAMANDETERLQKLKKLSLVLDLDHTLIHATPDSRAGQFHVSSGNHDSHPDVRTIRLRCLVPPQAMGQNPNVPSTIQHYVKLRPHVTEFLKAVQSKYEVTVYTAGTREYAEQIVLILARSIVGSYRDWDDLEQLRLEVETAQSEYDAMQRKLNPENRHQEAVNLSTKEDIDESDGSKNQKRKVEMAFSEQNHQDETTPDNGETDEPIKKKRKVVSFGMPESTKHGQGPMMSQKSDHITKEKLEELKREVKAAYDLEDKARDVRQSLFGSRLVSRTDVGDLGSDVKSLRRIFPCGGTMAVAVDDREDVWANAKDNTSSTVKGEPPANLLPVRPYHWERFQGMKDINNSSGADPSSGGGDKGRSDPNRESDPSLLWIKDILDRLYDRYYQQDLVGGKVQTVPDTLKKMRGEVLDGKRLVLSGLIPRHRLERFKEGGPRPTIVRWGQDLGAKIQEVVEYGVTHVVTGREHAGSQKSLDALKTPGCVLIQDNWLFDSYWSMSLRDMKSYLIGVGKGKIPATANPPSAETFLKTSYPDISQLNQRTMAGDNHQNFGPSDMIGSDMMAVDGDERMEDHDEDDDDDDEMDDLEDEYAAAFEEDFQCA
mmetsp:Transcript_4629/g.11768  ORF Transcript_4629/g.11768 Transcript_4629/m.11768 type:complete len:875 (-) Transcript_4629:50-2674(-)